MAANSLVNPNFPIPGIDQSSRGFRDNFSIIKTEIENLQGKTITLVGDVTGDALIDSGGGDIVITTTNTVGAIGPTGPQGPAANPNAKYVNNQFGDYTITQLDLGNIITVSSTISSSIFIPNTLEAGFYTSVVRIGNGNVVIIGSGITVNSPTNNTAITSKYGSVSVSLITSDIAILQGSI